MLNILGNIIAISIITIMIIVGFFENQIGPELADSLRWAFIILMPAGLILSILYDLFN